MIIVQWLCKNILIIKKYTFTYLRVKGTWCNSPFKWFRGKKKNNTQGGVGREDVERRKGMMTLLKSQQLKNPGKQHMGIIFIFLAFKVWNYSQIKPFKMHHIPAHWRSQERNREKKAVGQWLVYKILKGASLPQFKQPH